MISAQEARNIILSSVKPLSTITVSLARARHYAVAEKIISGDDIPPFDNSAMDGYAVRYGDIKSVPIELTVVGEIGAGVIFQGTLQQNEAVSIMTGAPIPDGANTVVPIEFTEQTDQSRVKILRNVSFGENIRRAGEDVKRGSVVLDVGTTLRPQELGVLAALGKNFVQIYKPANVAILTTGDEVIDMENPLKPGEIRNSNLYVLRGLSEELGCEVVDLGNAKDNINEIRQKVIQGLESDALITSGGVSVGKYDFIKKVLQELNAEIKIQQVNIKPGKPFVFALLGSKTIFGLPGNPVSSMVTFLHFVKPALLKLMGRTSEIESDLKIKATLVNEIKKSDGKMYFLRGILESKNREFTVRSTGAQSSHLLTSLTKANCLIIIPENKDMINAGDKVEVCLI
ncbi:MAG TPA: gephyrin-like molybdotransferase Glp [Bacteroidota bacterium]|nr:gephyrin-like molybdotransferase Glp [Bacteroidota bacterium]